MSGNGYTTGKAVGVLDQVAQDVFLEFDHGMTVAELRRKHPEHHHGTLSGALSHLHREGTLAMLTEKRERCHVYVYDNGQESYIAGRETKPHGRNNRANINA